MDKKKTLDVLKKLKDHRDFIAHLPENISIGGLIVHGIQLC